MKDVRRMSEEEVVEKAGMMLARLHDTSQELMMLIQSRKECGVLGQLRVRVERIVGAVESAGSKMEKHADRQGVLKL